MSQIPSPRRLDEDLVLRAVASDADAEKVIAINGEIHGEGEGGIVRHWLFEGHPHMERGDWFFIEDERTGRAAATLSLMPTTWLYGGQPLPVAELGFVATLPAYRRRGLQRLLSEVFDQIAVERGYTLAAIEGIPGFYGQFGYEYAVPLLGGCDLAFEDLPEVPPLAAYTLRRATLEDLPALAALYDTSIAALDVAGSRDTALWEHQVAVPEQIIFYGTTTVIERGDRMTGYVRWTDDDWSDRLRVLELAVDGGPGAQERILAALRFARERGRSAGKRGLRLQLPGDHPAVEMARYLGGDALDPYGWQMKVLDPVSFLWEVKPALEARLARSVLAGYSGPCVFDLFRSQLALGFEDGELAEAVKVAGDEEDVRADARMTLKQATQLWLGWRGREALEGWYPDFWTRESSQHLLDVLFPKARAYIYMPY